MAKIGSDIVPVFIDELGRAKPCTVDPTREGVNGLITAVFMTQYLAANYSPKNHTHSGYASSDHIHGSIDKDGTVTMSETPSGNDPVNVEYVQNLFANKIPYTENWSASGNFSKTINVTTPTKIRIKYSIKQSYIGSKDYSVNIKIYRNEEVVHSDRIGVAGSSSPKTGDLYVDPGEIKVSVSGYGNETSYVSASVLLLTWLDFQ